MITTLAKQANVTTESGNQVSAHKLRHTFATTLYNKNPKVDVLILGSLLGHSDPNSTKIYTQISKDVMRDVLETDLYNMDNK
ncbi:tyrosine-type recombinase/integrase [Paenibacillus sp. FSL W7-1287]|uniref:tyrosine-type recombinase/integrase n=1 Tax=Paenibacillus sp. FSL W7-1287 TaxID=2954538 RepID=UPI004046C1E7